MLELLTPARGALFAERIRLLFAQLQGFDSRQASQLLGSLCEEPGTRISPTSAEEIWISKDGHKFSIGQMAPEHLAHSLAYVVRRAREDKSCWAIRPGDGALRMYRRWPREVAQ